MFDGLFEFADAFRPDTIPTFSYPDDMLTALEYVDEFVAQSTDYPIAE